MESLFFQNSVTKLLPNYHPESEMDHRQNMQTQKHGNSEEGREKELQAQA